MCNLNTLGSTHFKGKCPLITIITVVFNGAQLLEETILSIVNQSYSNIEYIVIDGGSVDGTLDIIRKYEAHINCWVSEKDTGIYDAMNKGITRASGTWVSFLNAGDVLVDDKFIESHIDCFTNNYLLAFSFREYFYDADGAMYSRKNRAKYSKHDLPTAHNAIFFPLMKSIKYNLKYKISSDYDFYLQYLETGCELKLFNAEYMRYLIGGISEQSMIIMLYEKYLINVSRNKLFIIWYPAMLYKVFVVTIVSFMKNLLPISALKIIKLSRGYISEKK
jgi:glycosyltransferase involved in cell wall biosynthesis